MNETVEPAAAFDAAVAAHRAGRFDEARSRYQRLLDAAPDHPRVLHLLGIVETQLGRLNLGVDLIRRSFPALEKFAEPHVDLGNALRLSGKLEEAAESYRQAIARKPDYALAHTCLGSVLTDLGRYEAAITHCRTAVSVEPKSIPARIALTAALRGAGKMPEVARTWREVIEMEPGRPQTYHQLALQLIQLGLMEEALFCYDRAIALQPDGADLHCGRSGVLLRLYDGKGAEAGFRHALSLAPNSKEAWAGLGWALRMLGRFAEADDCARKLHELDPGDLRDVRHVPSTGNQSGGPAEMDRLASILEDPTIKPDDRITAGFALGRLLEDSGRFDEAFPKFATANDLMRRHWPANGDRFEAKAFARSVDGLIASNTPQYIAEAVDCGNISEMPIFVVGMPRSGTTLVEQICASHSRVFGAGELDAIPRLARKLLRDRGDEARLAEAGRRLADRHVVELHRLGRGALRVVDKMPDNILLVGLIARMFPRARIVYCSRDARDIALSCYLQVFAEGAQYFSYDLADCGYRCRDVQRLATHWLGLRPLHMLEVNYEKLVGDLESESRRLIEFLGLEWEPACLQFHRTERTVATVSHWQVRQPIYGSSIGRWRHYERHLGSLFEALGAPVESSTASLSTSASRVA